LPVITSSSVDDVDARFVGVGPGASSGSSSVAGRAGPGDVTIACNVVFSQRCVAGASNATFRTSASSIFSSGTLFAMDLFAYIPTCITSQVYQTLT